MVVLCLGVLNLDAACHMFHFRLKLSRKLKYSHALGNSAPENLLLVPLQKKELVQNVTTSEEKCCFELYHDHGSPEAHLCRQHDTLRKAKEMAKAPPSKPKSSSSTKDTPPPRALTAAEQKQVQKAVDAAITKTVERETAQILHLHGTTKHGKGRVAPQIDYQAYMAYLNTLPKYKDLK